MYIIKRTVRLVKQQGKRGVFQVFFGVLLEFVKMWGQFFYQRSFFVSFLKSPFLNKKKCIYTVLTGDYDDLLEPECVTPGWDYICVTDNKELRSECWTFYYLEPDDDLDNIRLARKHKCFNHLFDYDYDISIFIDANIVIKGNLNYFLMISFDMTSDMAVLFHPYLLSVKEEVDACIVAKRDNKVLMTNQFNHYIENGFVDSYVQPNTRLLIRKSQSSSIFNFMATWFHEIQSWSYRDQLSFSFSLDKSSSINIRYIEYWKFLAYFQKKEHK